MSLLIATLSLCKKIKQSNARIDLLAFNKKMYESWKNPGPFINKIFYELFKKSNYQFLSFISEFNKMESNANIKKDINGFIQRQEFDLIINLNNFILYINDRCLKSLNELNPNFFKPVHPYSFFEYRFESNSKDIFNNLINECGEIIDEIVLKYKNLKAVTNLESIISNSEILKTYPSEFWEEQVKRYITLINKKGLFEVPEELTTRYSQTPLIIREVLFNLISLRSSHMVFKSVNISIILS